MSNQYWIFYKTSFEIKALPVLFDTGAMVKISGHSGKTRKSTELHEISDNKDQLIDYAINYCESQVEQIAKDIETAKAKKSNLLKKIRQFKKRQ